jgi:nitrogen fixation protein FixH
VIAVNVVFMVFALQSFPGEDVRRSYLQGLAYNDTLAEREAQAELGWRAAAELRSSITGAELVIIMRDRDGAPLDRLTLTAELRRPADDSMDRSLSFVSRGNGVYVATLGGLAPGDWRLRARAADSGSGALDFESELPWQIR